MMRINYMLLCVLFVFLLPNVLSIDLSINTMGSADQSNDIYYISQNTSRQIMFELSSDYLSGDLINTSEAIYSLELFSESDDLKNIDVSLSKEKDVFISDIYSEFSLNIVSHNFINDVIKAKISIILFDKYKNIISTDYKIITLISNNSQIDFTYTPNRAEPSLQGYSFSKNKLFLFNRSDFDSLIIKEYIQDNYNYPYSIECLSESDAIIYTIEYIQNNEFKLIVSIDENKQIERGMYYLECNLFNALHNTTIKPIIIKYFDVSGIDQNKDENSSLIVSTEKNKSKLLNNLIIKIKSVFSN